MTESPSQAVLLSFVIFLSQRYHRAECQLSQVAQEVTKKKHSDVVRYINITQIHMDSISPF